MCINKKNLFYYFRYPELLKTQIKSNGTVHSDRNSSYDNVEKRNERINNNSSLEIKKEKLCDFSEAETILETEDSDTERIKRNKSLKELFDPSLSKSKINL